MHRMGSLLIVIVLDLADHVSTAYERHYVTLEVDTAVAGQIQKVAFNHGMVLTNIAFLQYIIQVELDRLALLIIVNQENLLFGCIFGETVRCADGIEQFVGLRQLVKTWLIYFAQDVDACRTELRNINCNLRIDKVFG